MIKQSEIIKVWDLLHNKLNIGYSDLDEAMSEVFGVETDISQEPEAPTPEEEKMVEGLPEMQTTEEEELDRL